MKSFPKKPGVYLFKDENNKIIYVGKANNLNNRIKSYFSKKHASPKTKVLSLNIKEVDFFITNNEVEALLLENKLIKKHSPKYNINLKDDKTYAYIKVTDEKLPRIISSRRVTRKGKFFGPYPDGYARALTIKLLNNYFQLCRKSCFSSKSSLNYQIGLCRGACMGKESAEEYNKRVSQAIKVLKGNVLDLEKNIQNNLKKYSDEKKYELALIQRNLLASLEILKQKQSVDEVRFIDQDIIGIEKEKDFVNFSVLHIKKGTILDKENFKLKIEEDVQSKFLTNYYYDREIPHEIIVSEQFWIDDKEKEILEAYFEKISRRKTNLIYPQRGEKKKLVELALKNISQGEEKILELMQEKLALSTYPKVIECFDISNLKDEFIVGAMTQFIDGKPNKNGYRKFKIRSINSQDDFAGIYEVVKRRYFRLLKENKALPDLIIIDGGKGQFSVAKKALNELRIDLEMVSLAKQEETIIKENEIISLDKNKQPMLLIRKIRDYTHRLAISYNKQLRRKRLKED